jgi:hypothetical protein|tara:strand:- start:690 stop:1139 length:450 start_codon:yes stop_codon:yes gene_type:complete
MRKPYRKKRGPVNAKKITVDGITFASGLERYMYQALKKAKIPAVYEGHTYEIFPAFHFDMFAYERCANGKGDYKDRGHKKILNISYTPDFMGQGFIIECKGRANESFPLRWKMFKRYVMSHLPGVKLYKPQNQKECDETVRLILESKSS